MLTTVGIRTSTRSAKLCGASRAAAGATRMGWASIKPAEATAASAVRVEKPLKTVKFTTDLQRRSRPTSRIGRRRVFNFLSTGRAIVAQIKRPLCDVEARGFPAATKKKSAAWQVRHSRRLGCPGLLLAELFLRRRDRSRRLVEIAEEIAVGAHDHGAAAAEGLLVGLHAPPESIEILVAAERPGVDPGRLAVGLAHGGLGGQTGIGLDDRDLAVGIRPDPLVFLVEIGR